MCEDNIVILSILPSYVLHWYHMCLLHPVMNRKESMICQCCTLQLNGVTYTTYNNSVVTVPDENLISVFT